MAKKIEPLTDDSWGELDDKRVQLKDVPPDRRCDWEWTAGGGLRPFRFSDDGGQSLRVVPKS